MSENKVEQLRDEGSRMQVVAAGAIAGLVSRYRHPTLSTLSACATLAFLSTISTTPRVIQAVGMQHVSVAGQWSTER